MLKGIKELNLKEGDVGTEVSILMDNSYLAMVKEINDEIKLKIQEKKDHPMEPEPPADQDGPLKNIRIVIDPGHGGTSIGAVGPQGTREKDIALGTGLILREKLKGLGADVLMTREKDTNVTLAQRVEVANKSEADLFISVHYNGFADPTANGTETYWYLNGSETSERLANSIQRLMVIKLGRRDRGVKQANFYVLRETDMPAVLVEPLFLTNPTEENLAKSISNQRKVAEAVLEGIIEIYP